MESEYLPAGIHMSSPVWVSRLYQFTFSAQALDFAAKEDSIKEIRMHARCRFPLFMYRQDHCTNPLWSAYSSYKKLGHT
jgi:hypothetical protein